VAHWIGNDGQGRNTCGDGSPDAGDSGNGVIVWSHDGAVRYGCGFLARGEVKPATHGALAILHQAPLLDAANADHLAEEMAFLRGGIANYFFFCFRAFFLKKSGEPNGA